MNDRMILSEFMSAIKTVTDEQRNTLREYGVFIGKLYTNMGLPIDMAMDRVDASKSERMLILHGALGWLIEHRRLSGAPEKAIERQRLINKKALASFIKGKEVGMY